MWPVVLGHMQLSQREPVCPERGIGKIWGGVWSWELWVIGKLEGFPVPGSLEEHKAGSQRKAIFECGGPAIACVNSSLGRLHITGVTRSACFLKCPER